MLYYDRLLQRFSGCNFQAYVRNIRIEQAIKLMEDKNSPIQFKVIASEVGFESSSSFSRAFKASKGMTASEWRSGKGVKE
ncbi:MAG: helix-turn-helix transcriptional regulator [Rikenellaceae bacterium]